MARPKKMELTYKLKYKIYSETAEFRCLKPSDVNFSYIKALKEQKEFLNNNSNDVTIKSQQEYVDEIIDSKSNTICGLFINSTLIGTAGAQNLLSERPSTIGIFVLSRNKRGKGFGKALVWSGSYLINHLERKKQIMANMDKKNIPSLKSFLSCGYKITEENISQYWVTLNKGELNMPSFINNYQLSKT